jgi:hypothetical protein
MWQWRKLTGKANSRKRQVQLPPNILTLKADRISGSEKFCGQVDLLTIVILVSDISFMKGAY